MTLNERLKKVRKDLDLTQKEFGLRIGLKGNSIALIEGGRPTSDQTIYAICRTFNVSETWLRTGEGEMYESKGTDALGDYLKERGVTELEEEIIRAWMELPSKERKELLSHFQRRLANRGVISAISSTAEEYEETPEERHKRHEWESRATPPSAPKNVHDWTDAEMHAELQRQLDAEKRETDESSTSFSGNSGTATA